MSAADDNPKTEAGNKKVPFSVIPCPVLAELAIAMYEGARKYGRHNYRSTTIHTSTYYDATMRHLMAWWEGEDFDPGTNGRVHHITKAIASLTVLRDAMLNGSVIDDRPPMSPPDWLEEFNTDAEALLILYPDSVEPHTEANRVTKKIIVG